MSTTKPPTYPMTSSTLAYADPLKPRVPAKPPAPLRTLVSSVIALVVVVWVLIALLTSDPQRPTEAPSTYDPGTKAEVASLPPVKAPAQYEAARVAEAKLVQDSFLEQGIDVAVTVSGREHRSITLRSVLVGRVFVYQFEHSGLLRELEGLGFTRIVVTDGHGSSWTW
jgi:hypothetical protein